MIDDAQKIMSEYIVRDARASDIEDIVSLSAFLNSVNLPSNRAELEQVIHESERSFSLEEKDATKRSFLFVLINKAGRVVGTSQIFAKHGTLASPHHYFQVFYDERYSETLKKYFRHRTLKLSQCFDGPTEVGSLVLDQSLRASPEKLGQTLSYVRFLFMAIRPEFFATSVIAELLPPLGPNFESALWDAVGRKLTGLDYYEADMLCRKNKEFIKTLFPSGEIHVSLLPEAAQEVIGQVGRNSKGAAHLLSKIGFFYSHRVDPFDGGPHFEADLEDITLIQNAVHAPVTRVRRSLLVEQANVDFGLCGRFDPARASGERFCAYASVFAHDDGANMRMPEETLDLLKVHDRDHVSAVSLVD